MKKVNNHYKIITLAIWLLANLILFLNWNNIPDIIMTHHGFDEKSSIITLVMIGWAAYALFICFDLLINYFDKKEYHQHLYGHMRCLNVETKFLCILTLSYIIISYALNLKIFGTIVYIFAILIVLNMGYRIYHMIKERKRHYR